MGRLIGRSSAGASRMVRGAVSMSVSEVKIYTTFDSFEADQVIATLALYDIPSVKRRMRSISMWRRMLWIRRSGF